VKTGKEAKRPALGMEYRMYRTLTAAGLQGFHGRGMSNIHRMEKSRARLGRRLYWGHRAVGNSTKSRSIL